MLFHSILRLTMFLVCLFFVIVQSEQSNTASSHHTKVKIPVLGEEEASQWLSTRNIPHRWRHQRPTQLSNEIDQTLKQLQSLNDNGIRQFNTQSFEGVSMEVIFEMVYKQQDAATSR